MSAPTSLKAGDPVKMGELIGVYEAVPGDPTLSPPGWYWRDKAGGSLEAFEWDGPYDTEDEARENAITPMTLNRAALPTTPKYPATAKALFAQLREMGVSCASCKSFDAEYWNEPGRNDGRCRAEGSDEVFENWGRKDEDSHIKPTFLCNEWEAGE